MPIQVVRGLFLKLKSRIFPGVWFARRNVEGTVYLMAPNSQRTRETLGSASWGSETFAKPPQWS